ncbi:MAG: Holliday junction resolvase RuvX [Bacteroidota bacterium]|nr:Holliday junction resolvase RuvX [Bacteroidota bacterium]MDE2833414.1 Holliday junction resolvase RuvX [Bacteroidota bacterium]MDE2956530.1 Holliday junction resolvase RuvX [Bacteroidota bacterium]
MKRIVAVDYGTRRTGVALADPLGLFAQPFGTWSPGVAADRLAELHRREGIAVIVIGWPLMEDGTEGAATERVEAYIRHLTRRLRGTTIVRWDERYTTEEARDRLRGCLRRGQKKRVDMLAAGLILQEYLEASETETPRHRKDAEQ